MDNSVIQQYDVCARYLHLFGETGSGNIPEIDLYILHDWNVGNDAWFDAGSGAADWNPVHYTQHIDAIGL